MPEVAERPSVADQIQELEGNQGFGDSQTLKADDLKSGEGRSIEDILAEAGMTEDDLPEKPEKKEEAEPEKPAIQEDPEEEEEPETPEAPEPDENASIGKQLLDEFLSSDKGAASTLTTLFKSASAEAQSDFISSLTKQADAATDFDANDLETEFERQLHPVFKDIKALPEFKDDTIKAFRTHADHINRASLKVHALEAMVETLAEAAGVTLPKRDYEGYLKNTSKGYEEAIKPLRAALQKSLKNGKQNGKPRPADARSEAGGTVQIDEKDSLLTRIRKAQASLT